MSEWISDSHISPELHPDKVCLLAFFRRDVLCCLGFNKFNNEVAMLSWGAARSAAQQDPQQRQTKYTHPISLYDNPGPTTAWFGCRLGYVEWEDAVKCMWKCRKNMDTMHGSKETSKSRGGKALTSIHPCLQVSTMILRV